MAQLIDISTFTDKRGNLTVIDKNLPFAIKRIFYIYGVDDSRRGGHRHKLTRQAANCIRGSCKVYSTNGIEEETYYLENPSKCLIIEPEDWHEMFDFSEDAILMVLASEHFDESDYIYPRY